MDNAEYLRNVSTKYFKNFGSKWLEDNEIIFFNAILNKDEHEEYRSIKKESDSQAYKYGFECVNILLNPRYVAIKGEYVIEFNNGSKLVSENKLIQLSEDYIKDIKCIKVNNVLTVENLTTFNYINHQNALIVYTEGFPNLLVVAFLKKVLEFNKGINIMHFGDIDAFGFEILNTLRKKTKYNIKEYKMDEQQYLRYVEDCGIELNEINKEKFIKMLSSLDYSNDEKKLFSLILDKGKILEQEGII